jgi:hypothetical protein
MTPAVDLGKVPVPPPAYHRAQHQRRPSLRIDALTLVTRLHVLQLCRLAVHPGRQRCPPPLPAGPGGRPRRYPDESLLLLGLIRTLWRLSYQDLHDWLVVWPALALVCGLLADASGHVLVPSASQQYRRGAQAGAPACECLLVVLVRLGCHRHLISGRDLVVDSAPILAWQRRDPDAAVGHAPHHHARPLVLGYRVHTLLCRESSLPLLCFLAPANFHDAPFAQHLLAWAVRLYGLRPRVVRPDAGYWALRLIAWIYTALGAVVVVLWNANRQKNRSCLSPTWTAEEVGKRRSIERFFGRVFSPFGLFRLQRPPLAGSTAVARTVALTYAATIVVGLAAHQAGRPDQIRSTKRVLAHTWDTLLE